MQATSCTESSSLVTQDPDRPIGSLQTTWKKCGKVGCKCQRGQLHGPYYRRVFREEDGRQRTVYVKRGDVERVRGECDQARAVRVAQRQEERLAATELDRQLRILGDADRVFRELQRLRRKYLKPYGLKAQRG